jgi:hypothetical protein
MYIGGMYWFNSTASMNLAGVMSLRRTELVLVDMTSSNQKHLEDVAM